MKLINTLDDVIDNDKSLNKVGFLSEGNKRKVEC